MREWRTVKGRRKDEGRAGRGRKEEKIADEPRQTRVF